MRLRGDLSTVLGNNLFINVVYLNLIDANKDDSRFMIRGRSDSATTHAHHELRG